MSILSGELALHVECCAGGKWVHMIMGIFAGL